jgi:putative AdoMet-dependent methyltransferase
MLSQCNSSKIFDEWAPHHDEELSDGRGFPFEGYEAVLNTIVHKTELELGMEVLDLGIGTGSLTSRFVALDYQVW